MLTKKDKDNVKNSFCRDIILPVIKIEEGRTKKDEKGEEEKTFVPKFAKKRPED